MVFDFSMQSSSPAPEPRIAVITGASRGIGLATARHLAAEGLHVVLAARTEDAIRQAAKELNSEGLSASAQVCDVSDLESCAGLLDVVDADFGRLDVLVNNAGILQAAAVAERMPVEDWDRSLQINLTAPWFLASRAKRLMAAGSVVVNIASTAGYYPSRGLSGYHVSKAGLLMLTRALALEWARDGIRVVGIAPGKIDTELLGPIKKWSAKEQIALNPMNRLGTAEEVAALVAYVVDSPAGYLTGVTIPLDGGELLQPFGSGLA
jgi:NAD(P)-dependent dehydrogenase (short-subunit alcohol dehydrogenase family)